jgi:hypothetical protein
MVRYCAADTLASHSGGGPRLDGCDRPRQRGVPVDTDGVLVFGALGAPSVADVVDGSEREHLRGAAVGDDRVAGLQLAQGPQLVGFFADRRFGAVVREMLAEGVAERVLALELREITDLVPAHADVAVGPAVIPVFGQLTRRDLDDGG